MLSQHDNVEGVLNISLYFMMRDIFKIACKLKMFSNRQHIKKDIKLLAESQRLADGLNIIN
jgi:hypothetical protein